MTAPINRIIDSSVVDGPGNRTAVFFQGCNFNCRYCHNPETIRMCSHCGECIRHCPTHALRMTDNKIIYHAQLCRQCDQCIRHCRHQASPRIMWMTAAELEAHIAGNLPFIRGVTCSGGECTLHSEYIKELFSRLHKRGLSCLLDSNGAALDFQKEPALMSVTDGVMLDIKATDRRLHEALTGSPNDLVLKNARYLASIHKLLEIRTVMTKKLLENEQTIVQTGELLAPYLQEQNIRYRLIRFRPNGVREAYRDLGTPTEAEMSRLKELAENCGFRDIIIT